MSYRKAQKLFEALADVMKDPSKAALAEASMKVSAAQADHTLRMHKLAYEAAEKLDLTTDDLEALGEKYTDALDDMEFLKRLDLLVFCCVKCNWWKRQRENATPDAAEWACKECTEDGM